MHPGASQSTPCMIHSPDSLAINTPILGNPNAISSPVLNIMITIHVDLLDATRLQSYPNCSTALCWSNNAIMMLITFFSLSAKYALNTSWFLYPPDEQSGRAAGHIFVIPMLPIPEAALNLHVRNHSSSCRQIPPAHRLAHTIHGLHRWPFRFHSSCFRSLQTL